MTDSKQKLRVAFGPFEVTAEYARFREQAEAVRSVLRILGGRVVVTRPTG